MESVISFEDLEQYSSSDLTGFAFDSTGVKPQAVIFRLLSGTCKVQNTVTGKESVSTINYFKGCTTENTHCSLLFLDSFQEGLKCSDYDTYLKGSS